MSNYVNLMNNLELLKLDMIKEKLDKYIDAINKGEKNIVDSLLELSEIELKFRNERAMGACVKTGNFPFIKEFKDFDFSFQPSLKKEVLLDFESFRFVEKKENILFVGSSGVGKTHLATAIGIACAKQRFSTYFISCNDLIANLKKAHLENRLESRLNHYRKYRILIIDEIGYLPFDISAANMFFQLINKRYERNSTIITTNTVFSKWGDIFGDITIANAILDRLLHHSHVIKISGKSYRTKHILEKEAK